jgi:hypothetical protein
MSVKAVREKGVKHQRDQVFGAKISETVAAIIPETFFYPMYDLTEKMKIGCGMGFHRSLTSHLSSLDNQPSWEACSLDNQPSS